MATTVHLFTNVDLAVVVRFNFFAITFFIFIAIHKHLGINTFLSIRMDQTYIYICICYIFLFSLITLNGATKASNRGVLTCLSSSLNLISD